jgi:hypothetical protein
MESGRKRGEEEGGEEGERRRKRGRSIHYAQAVTVLQYPSCPGIQGAGNASRSAIQSIADNVSGAVAVAL